MKKALAIFGLSVIPAIVFAQGTVQFNNSTTTRITTNSTAVPPPGQNANAVGNMAAGQFTVGLYVAPQGTVNPDSFSLVGTTPSLGGVGAGTFNGNPTTGSFVINGNNGETIAFQIRAWQVSAGSSYELATAANVYRGFSTIGQVTPATGLLLAPALFGTSAGQIGAFSMTPNPGVVVPEPSTIALGLLGLGAVAFLRRRK